MVMIDLMVMVVVMVSFSNNKSSESALGMDNHGLVFSFGK